MRNFGLDILGALLAFLIIYLVLPYNKPLPPPSIQEATLYLMCTDPRKIDSVHNKLYTCSVHRNKDD